MMASPQSSVQSQINNTKSLRVLYSELYKKSLSLPSGPLVIGVSGGLDSCVLLHLLHLAVDRQKNPISVCYVQHGIREEEPEARALPALCQSLGLDFYPYRLAKGWLRRQASLRGLSLEDLGRCERYRRLQYCLRSVVTESGQTWGAVVLAHHADDQAESFLMNLGRGAGPRSLCGMREWSKSKAGFLLWRPLLTWSRLDLQCWAKEKGIPYWEDSTNFDSSHLRNFYRLEVIPQLKCLVPGLLQGIRRSQQHLLLLGDWLEQERDLLKAQLQVAGSPAGELQVAWYGDLENLPKPLQIELIFLLFEHSRRGEQRRRRLPLGFVLELLKQRPASMEAHGCLWHWGPRGIFVRTLPHATESTNNL
ncbi:MAG: tRNA lysidine(34) synthetase TilS [Spirochaetota bacterium]